MQIPEAPALIRHLLTFLAIGAIYQQKFRNRPDWICLNNFFYSIDIRELLVSKLIRHPATGFCHEIIEFSDQLISPLDFRPGLGVIRLTREVTGSKILYPDITVERLPEVYFYHYALDYSPYANFPLRTARLLAAFLPYFEVVSVGKMKVDRFVDTFDDATFRLEGGSGLIKGSISFTFDARSELTDLTTESCGVCLHVQILNKFLEVLDRNREICFARLDYSQDSGEILRLIGSSECIR